MAPSLRAVVLCADDFGLTEGVSRGILELARQGRISAVSVMTSRPWWARLAGGLRELDGTVGVGLHVTLTAGAPIGPMPALAPGGTFPSFGSLLRRALTARLPLREVGDEIARQLDAFEAAFGRPPDFIDGHQHVHVLPGIRRQLLDALARAAPDARPWLRDPSDSVPAIARRRLSAGKALIVKALASGFSQAAARAGFEVNAGFSGFSAFDPEADPATAFERFFEGLGQRPLVMCHPGHVDDELRSLDPVVETRVRELFYLASDRFANLLTRRGLTLVAKPAAAG